MNLIAAISSLYPELKGWTITNNDYNTLKWTDSLAKPSKSELETEGLRLDAVFAATEYQRRRAFRYPIESDPLMFEWIYLRENGSAETENKRIEWLAAVNKIKEEIPKPT